MSYTMKQQLLLGSLRMSLRTGQLMLPLEAFQLRRELGRAGVVCVGAGAGLSHTFGGSSGSGHGGLWPPDAPGVPRLLPRPELSTHPDPLPTPGAQPPLCAGTERSPGQGSTRQGRAGPSRSAAPAGAAPRVTLPGTPTRLRGARLPSLKMAAPGSLTRQAAGRAASARLQSRDTGPLRKPDGDAQPVFGG